MGMSRSVLGALRRVMGVGMSRHKSARFRLKYVPPEGGKSVVVGHLLFEGGQWSFSYDPEYRHRSDLRPIEGFDDMGKVYRQKALFPFFAVRVPPEDRPDVRRRLEQDHVEEPDTTDLLRMFGRRAAASPAFELVES
jgi:HipA-like protein